MSYHGADNHIVYILNNGKEEEIFLKDLNPGMYIITETGAEEIISIENNNEYENMYDLEVNSKNHTYYTNRNKIA